MKLKTYQAAFVSGEISPTLLGRTDKEFYFKSAAHLRNVYVLPQGGVKRREGLEYIARVTNDSPGRLISFEFNTEQAYLLLFTPGQMKVFKDDELVATVNTSPISNLTAAMIREMNWTQSADTLILVHKDLQPIKIVRGATHTSWTASAITFTNIPNYDFGSGNEPVISNTRGWVRSVTFKFGRLWLGGLGSRPQTLLASKVGDFFNLNEGTGLDDEAINITIDDDRVNAIRNLFPGRTLQVFTTGGEFVVQPSLGDPVTPGKIAEQLKKATLHGCSRTRPVSVDGATIFVEGSGYVVRQFVYNELEQSYNAGNVSLLAPHLVRVPLQMDVRRATEDFPADYVHLVNTDGTLAVLNILRDEQLLAWSLFQTDGLFEDVSVVGTQVYVIVQRTIQGLPVRYIEKFNPAHKLDSSLISATAVQSTGLPWHTMTSQQAGWSGWSHLEGKTVRVIGDDYVLDSETVVSGGFTTSEIVGTVEAGLDFKAKIETLPVEMVIAGQSESGQFKRLVSANLRLLESRGVVVEQKNGKRYKPAWRQFGASVLDKLAEVFTGWKKIYLGGFDRDTQLVITQEDPLEFHVLALNLEVGI